MPSKRHASLSLRTRCSSALWSARFNHGPRIERLLGKPIRQFLDRFNEKTIVLVISAGRCGSNTLHMRMKALPDFASLHEPMPHYRFILKQAQHDPMLAARFFGMIKAPALASMPQSRVLESNHLFGKGFFEPAIAMGYRFSTIALIRDTRATAVSHLRKGGVPGRTPTGLHYQIAPDDNPYLRIADHASLSDYQLCYWYCLEMELRAKLYGQVCERLGRPFLVLDIEELNDRGRFVDGMVRLGLDSGGGLNASSTQRLSKLCIMPARKRRSSRSTSISTGAKRSLEIASSHRPMWKRCLNE